MPYDEDLSRDSRILSVRDVEKILLTGGLPAQRKVLRYVEDQADHFGEALIKRMRR